jgi:hypothetical protein
VLHWRRERERERSKRGEEKHELNRYSEAKQTKREMRL